MKVRDTGIKVSIPSKNKRRKGFTGSTSDWEQESRGKIDPNVTAAIAILPRVESKSSQSTELLAQLREENSDRVKNSRLPDQNLMRRNEAQRKGKPMHHIQFLKKLRGAGIKAWYNEVPFEGLIGLRCIRRGYELKGIPFICAVKLGWTTEFDIFHYDARGVELNKRFVGWRSVILALVATRIISESEAYRIFGKPAANDASLLFRRSMRNVRTG
jgi:hypothetical protein